MQKLLNLWFFEDPEASRVCLWVPEWYCLCSDEPEGTAAQWSRCRWSDGREPSTQSIQYAKGTSY